MYTRDIIHTIAIVLFYLAVKIFFSERVYNFFLSQDVSVCFFGLVCCFTSQSTAMVMSGQSVQLTTFFPEQA